jgi:hypothetical protein
MVSGGSGRVADRWIRPGRKGKFVFFSCRVTYGNSCSNFIIGSYSVGALRASRPIAFVHVAFCLVNTGFNLQQSRRQISALRRQGFLDNDNCTISNSVSPAESWYKCAFVGVYGWKKSLLDPIETQSPSVYRQ